MKDPTLHDIEIGLRGNLLADFLEGWTFRVEEVSSNMYRIEGWDSMAHRVSYSGPDPVVVLQKCIQRAQRLREGKGLFSSLKLLVRRIFMRGD